MHQHAVLKAPERTDRVNATSLQPRERRELQTRDRGREQAQKKTRCEAYHRLHPKGWRACHHQHSTSTLRKSASTRV